MKDQQDLSQLFGIQITTELTSNLTRFHTAWETFDALLQCNHEVLLRYKLLWENEQMKLAIVYIGLDPKASKRKTVYENPGMFFISGKEINN